MKFSKLLAISCMCTTLLSPPLYAKNLFSQFSENWVGPSKSSPISAPANSSVEVAFSPEAGAEALVIKFIASATQSLRLAAYSFTSPPVVRALLDAKRRGVDVEAVVDYKGNHSKSSLQALNLLVNAGIPVRTISVYSIHHDKYIEIDNDSIENGSFNYTASAAHRNSENALVVWHNPVLAQRYLAHWQSRYNQGQVYQSTY